MFVTIAIIVMATIAVGAFEIWLFWRVGERDDRRRSRARRVSRWEDPQVVELGDDCGVVVYRAVARRPGDEPYAAVVSSTFVREHDGWKLAFQQQSPPS